MIAFLLVLTALPLAAYLRGRHIKAEASPAAPIYRTLRGGAQLIELLDVPCMLAAAALRRVHDRCACPARCARAAVGGVRKQCEAWAQGLVSAGYVTLPAPSLDKRRRRRIAILGHGYGKSGTPDS